EQSLTIGNGLVFTKRNYNFSVDRDYDQRVTVAVRNEDSISHTLLLTIEVPTGDDELIVGFVGSGSEDQVITLEPGETRDVTLAIHTQDAEPNGEYDLVAHLTADGEEEPILDYAGVHVTVYVPVVDYTLEQIDYDPSTLVRTFRVTNNGNFALTDLAVDYEVVSGTGALLIAPSLNHARLRVGASLEFSAIPILDENFDQLSTRLVATAAGAERSVTFDVACDENCDVLPGQTENVMMEARNGDWYCTNRPQITTYVDLPGGFRRANVSSAELRVTIKSMWPGVRPHTAEFYVNGYPVGGYYEVVPGGVYIFHVDPAYLNETLAGVSRNAVTIVTTHMNGGHYVVSTDVALSICLTEYTEWVCAVDQTQADEIVSGRSYLIPAADAITTHILEPRDGDRFPVGSTIKVSAQVTDSLDSGRIYAVIGSADNDNGGLMLYDDGGHDDGLAGDGTYANTWTPLAPGQTTLTVEAGNCQIAGSDSATIHIYTDESRVDLAHGVPTSGAIALDATFSHPPLTGTLGSEDVTYNWTYVLSQTERARVTTFDVALPGMRPGEVRQVGSGTVVSYTTAGGHGVATLPPLYVAAAHLVSIAPPARETNPGGAASYQVTLYNPQTSADVFTLALEGLPTGWTTGTFGVPIGAGAKVVVPVTVSVPAEAALDDYIFAATVETSSGGQDSAQARLTVAD
ncbi:MAG: hypothetical protein GY719_10020, partial [bacterium]|nr:hypothetical protein [bacterium]